ncbi:UbiA family prenyltransferase [Halorubrum sp. CSM-61]|uniref:UbiA family prenyltransferase n=1 Tax=Halorubrum sp. CSM-61 TaxID=2485838 RepID=UPI001F15618C|nr:UbiA family prenyltransferase [Halorubrum sp. CSM-61]
MQDTRDPPSTAIDGTDETYRAEPTLDAESTAPEAGGIGTEAPTATGAAPTGAAVGAPPTRSAEPAAAAERTPPGESVSAEPAATGTTEPAATGTTEPTATSSASGLLQSLVELASGSPFVAAIAAVETVIATVLLGVPLSPAPAVVGLVAFAVYTVDHVADAAADARSTPGRARIARRYGDQLMLAAALAYGLALALSVAGGPLALGVALLPGAFWIAYASDWLPNAGRALRSLAPDGDLGTGVRLPRLKEVPVVGSAVVAAGWAIAVTLLPLAFAGSAALGSGSVGAAPVEPVVAVAVAYFFLRSFVDAELPNVRDVEADAAAGVSTLPIALGVARTRRVLYGVDLATAATLAAATATGVLSPGVAAALGVGLAASLAVTALAGRVDDAAVLGVAPDCSYLVVAAALAVVAA